MIPFEAILVAICSCWITQLGVIALFLKGIEIIYIKFEKPQIHIDE